MKRHIVVKISPLPTGRQVTPLCQRGGFLPFVKGGKEEFSFQCLYNYGLISKKALGKKESDVLGGSIVNHHKRVTSNSMRMKR